MTPVHQIGAIEVLALVAALWLVYKLLARTRAQAYTPLRGPASPSIVFGMTRQLNGAADAAALYEQWAAEYGPAYLLPSALGSARVVLTDPKAIAHVYARETFAYIKTPLSARFIEKIIGRGLLWAEGESHRRQRKALTPAFSNSAIRNLTSIFFDSAHQAQAAWDSVLETSSTGSAVIDVQEWMNHISLDSVGIAGFGYDFGMLKGGQSAVSDLFETFGNTKPSVASSAVFMLGAVIPALSELPTDRNILLSRLKTTMGAIADELLRRSREDRGIAEDRALDKSVIGLLLKAESADSELRISPEEVLAQMNVLILAGYETTSISLTWALVELCRHRKVQEQLREELCKFSGSDPTWDNLTYELPYLDAVVHEVLRVHPPLSETTRQAAEDDVIPLSAPVVAATGETVSSITVRKGTRVTVPIKCVNTSTALWGADAKEFRPERWLDGGVEGASAVQGHRHLLTFIDGPRICLGKNFALAEFKAVLSVLVRNYMFELPEGPKTEIAIHRAILPRPTVAGASHATMPLRVRRVE